MLHTGFRAGNIIDFRVLNTIIRDAEQIANVNIVGHLKGLTDNNATDTKNTVFFTQFRERLEIISIFISIGALPATSFPRISSVKDENGVDLSSFFTFYQDNSESVIKSVDNENITITFQKTSYNVASGGQNKRIELKFNPINAAKDFDDTKLDSVLIAQTTAAEIQISRFNEDGLSNITSLNAILEAFRLKFSYILTVFDNNLDIVSGHNDNRDIFLGRKDTVSSKIQVFQDFWEVGAKLNEEPNLIYPGGAIKPLQGSITNGSYFSYKQFVQNEKLLQALKHPALSINNATYLTTALTENIAINFIANDALNSLSLVSIKEDWENRLQGRLFYPIIGEELLMSNTGDVSGIPIDLDFEFNSIHSNSLELSNGYNLRYALFKS